ncbi:MAG TPA: HTTM domain-containing protein [Microbacterium sp.]|nr:HTTM domain-containing protein [Microbacterium sp.]
MRLVGWMTDAERATYSMSGLRILFGLAILWFLIASAADRHYLWGAGSGWVDPAVDRRGYPEFLRAFFPKSDAAAFDFSYGILIALAMLFIAGLATRVVTPLLLLFWIALSSNSVFLTNGGDVIIRLALLFCVFANLSRHWSLDAWWCRRRGVSSIYPRFLTDGIPGWVRNAAHNTAVLLCGYQVLLVYVNSGVYKLMGEEWLEGSALYYAFNLDVFRVFPALSDLAWQITPFVLVGSWISIWAQLLFPVLLLWRPTRYAALLIIMGMHFGIGLFLGLWPFSIAMIALDLVFVRDASWQRAWAWAGEVLRAMRARMASARVRRAVGRTAESGA